MSEHLNDQDVQQFLRGELAADRVAAILRHLDECPQCATGARSGDAATRAAEGMAFRIGADAEEHPSVETQLTAYVDGTLDAGERRAVEEHLATCAQCREDVEDLRAVQTAIRPRASYRLARIAAVAACAAIVAATAFFFLRRPAPLPTVPATTQVTQTVQPTTTTTIAHDEHPQWRVTVDDAVRTGVLRMPATLAALQLAPDQLRAPGGASAHLEPVGAIVESTRPRLTWTARPQATYSVSIFSGDTVVAESGKLRTAEWQPVHALERGRTYQWQVEVRDGDNTFILPAPPAPLALFRVLDAAAHRELEEARASRSDDHLLLGVLYARHGLRAEAEAELRRVDSDAGSALLRSVETWRR